VTSKLLVSLRFRAPQITHLVAELVAEQVVEVVVHRIKSSPKAVYFHSHLTFLVLKMLSFTDCETLSGWF
jgi:hypothetical protein